MLYCKKLGAFLLILTLFAAPLSPPLEARSRKGDKFYSEGRKAEDKKDYDEALKLYEQALSEDPADTGYQLAVDRVRFQAGQHHVEVGLKLRPQGKLTEALAEFEKAYALDPGSSIAEQEIRRTRAMIEREKNRAEAKPEQRGLTPSEVAKVESQERMDRMLQVPELKPLSSKAIDLKMNNQPAKVLFETVAKLAGINVVFDPDIPSTGKNLSVEFTNSTVEEALDYLSVLTKTFWKPLSGNTIFVTQDNQTKRRDYEDQVVKVFYLKNIGTPQELQEIATDVRTVCDIRRAFTYNSQMALILRGEADRVALAEKLINDLDKPKSEVVIDVLVLEHNTDDSKNLALGLTDGLNTAVTYNGAGSTAANNTGTGTSTTTTTTTGTTTVTNPTTTTGTTTPTATGASIALNQITHLSTGQYSVVLPNFNLQATLSKSNTHVLQNPQIRAANGGKATMKIGEKVPTASGSFQPGIGGVGINPLVNTQFQFIDVGVNVEITPTIHGGTDEVSLHVDMDISDIDSYTNLGGINQPVIGQRKVTFDVRMKEGQANVLGGLMQTTESYSSSGWPGLANIPLLGHLFSSRITDTKVNELIFVLIPHIVRQQEITETNLKGVATGSDTVVKLNYAPRRVAAAAPATPAAAATNVPMTAVTTTLPATAPADGPPATAPPASSARVSFAPTPAEGQLGSAIPVTLVVDNPSDLFTALLKLKFDAKVLRLNDVVVGPLLTADGKQILPPAKNILNDTGEASVTLSRAAGGGGVSNSGAMVTFIFQAAGKGTSTVSFSDFVLRDSKLEQIPAAPPQTTITVR